METGWKYYAARPYLRGLVLLDRFRLPRRAECRSVGRRSVRNSASSTPAVFRRTAFITSNPGGPTSPCSTSVPHWNWPGKEGQEIDVMCFSNCEEVELFLNGRSLGKQDDGDEFGHLEWKVKYEPGTLWRAATTAATKSPTDQVETTGDAGGHPAHARPHHHQRRRRGRGGHSPSRSTGRAGPRGAYRQQQNRIRHSKARAKSSASATAIRSCHEPDVFLQKWPGHSTAVTDWKWTRIPTLARQTFPGVRA